MPFRHPLSAVLAVLVLVSVLAPSFDAAAEAVELQASSLRGPGLQVADLQDLIAVDTSKGGRLTEEEIRGSVGALVLDPKKIHPDVLAQVHLDLSSVSGVADQLIEARLLLEDSIVRQDLAAIEARSSRSQRRLLVRQREDAQTVEETKSARRAEADAALGSFAVTTFVEYENLELNRMSADRKAQSLAGITDQAEVAIVDAALLARREHDESVAELSQMVEDVAEINRTIQEVDTQYDEAFVDEEAATETLERLGPAFEERLLQLVVPGTDIPVVVLDAYYRAELKFAQLYPSCNVTWSHLAGIGKVESGHGSFGGSAVGGDGRTSGRILGPQLNGDPFQAIPDTDGGRLDGDAVWDRAVGPMQFIPSSWAIFRHDGNGDGVADPHNIYDAAQAAADHLCRSTKGLGARQNFQRALLGYNRSVAYGQLVMSYTDRYQAEIGLESSSGGLALGPPIAEGPLTDPPPGQIDNPALPEALDADGLPIPPGGNGGTPVEVVADEPADPGAGGSPGVTAPPSSQPVSTQPPPTPPPPTQPVPTQPPATQPTPTQPPAQP